MFTYLKIGALVGALAVGAAGAWWIQGVRLDKAKASHEKHVQELHAELIGTRIDKERLNAKLEAAKRADKIVTRVRHETSTSDEVISSGDAGNVVDMFRQLREKGRLSDTPTQGKGGS